MKIGFYLILLITGTLSPHLALSQGCTQCRDNIQATRPQTQEAYREAIWLLAGTALSICSATAFALRKMR